MPVLDIFLSSVRSNINSTSIEFGILVNSRSCESDYCPICLFAQVDFNLCFIGECTEVYIHELVYIHFPRRMEKQSNKIKQLSSDCVIYGSRGGILRYLGNPRVRDLKIRVWRMV